MESENTPAAPEAVTEPSEAAAVAAPAAEAPAPVENRTAGLDGTDRRGPASDFGSVAPRPALAGVVY